MALCALSPSRIVNLLGSFCMSKEEYFGVYQWQSVLVCIGTTSTLSPFMIGSKQASFSPSLNLMRFAV